MVISVELIVFLLILCVSLGKNRANYYFRWLPYITIFLFMAIRYNYGDGIAYRQIFAELNSGINVNDLEIGYVLLNLFLPSFDIVVVVTSGLYVAAVYLLVSKVLTYQQRSLALLILALHPYILMIDMSAIRQGIAIAFVIMGTYIANKYRSRYFVIFCLTAALFHKSAIIMLPIVFLFNNKHFKTATKYLIFVGTVAFLAIPDKLLEVTEMALKLVGLNTPNYIYYLYNGNANGKIAVTISIGILGFLLLCENTVDEKNAIYVKLSIFAQVFEALQGVAQQFGRVDMYFLPFLIVSLPLILRSSQRNLQINYFGKTVVLGSNVCKLIELGLILIFARKLVGFLKPDYLYHSMFTIR